MNKFTKAINESMKGVGKSASDSFSGSFLDVLKGSAIGTMLGSLGTQLGSQIMEGLDVGIKRIDTIKNFPRVMESLGYSTREADASVKLIMEHLDGLPTTTQDMVTLTQAIADSTGDLDLATRAALGFNDMMLANGASAGEMTQAMGVFNRILGKGNATTAQWMSLQSVMPAQLALVARSMLGEKASAEDLRDALNNGEVSWNDFLAAIVRLDEDGTGHIASFAEQARANSDGIGTSLVNIQNRIGQGWAEILDVFGKSNISSTIDKFSYGIRDAMTAVADGLKWLKYTILGTEIDESVAKIFENIKTAIGDFDFSGLKDIARAFIDLIDGALKWVADNGDTVSTIMAAIAGAWAATNVASGIMGVATSFKAIADVLPLISGLADIPVAFTLIGEAGGPLAGVFTALGSALTFLAANPIVLVIAGIGALVAALTWWLTSTEEGQKVWQDFCEGCAQLWEGLKRDWENTVDQIKQNLEANKLVWENFKKSVSDKVNQVKTTVVNTWNALLTTLGTITTTIKTTVTSTWNALWTTVTTIVGGIYTTVTTKFQNARDTVLGVFDAIKTGIQNRLNNAYTTVSRIIDNIKGLFNFSWSLPRPLLPHISWHWESVGGLLNIPYFDGISWYARGGLFTQPTLAGLGEAGDEAALPLTDAVYSRIAQGISDQMGAGGILITGNTFNVRDEDDIQRIAERLATMIVREMGAAA